MKSSTLMIATLLIYTLVMLWLGLNVGVMVSMSDGPDKACRSLRFSLLDCERREL